MLTFFKKVFKLTGLHENYICTPFEKHVDIKSTQIWSTTFLRKMFPGVHNFRTITGCIAVPYVRIRYKHAHTCNVVCTYL